MSHKSFLSVFMIACGLALVCANEIALNRTRRGDSSGKCLMSGVCGDSLHGYIPCARETDHHKFENDAVALAMLKDECPELFLEGVDVPEVCCSADELKKLQRTIAMVSMAMPGCPSCTANLKEIFCHLTCAPDQDSFIEVLKTAKNRKGEESIAEINYYIPKAFSETLYSSCKDVPAMGVPAKKVFCRPFDENTCTGGKFLSFMGNDKAHRGVSPFQINFKLSDEKVEANGKTFAPANLIGKQCNEAAGPGLAPCPCNLCATSCPAR